MRAQAWWLISVALTQVCTSALGASDAPKQTAPVSGNATAAANKWRQTASWPDFQGGLWYADRADGSPNAQDLPLKPEAAEQAKELAKRFWSNEFGGSCKPRGMPRHLGNQFIYSRDMIVMLGQADYYQVVRRIYMDRKHEVIEPAYFGTSNGHWEGDTLVIDTTGFWPDQDLTDFVPGHGQTHIVERYKLLKPGALQLQLTIENPAVLTRPYQVTRVYTLQPGEETLESYCTNNRDLPGGAADLSISK